MQHGCGSPPNELSLRTTESFSVLPNTAARNNSRCCSPP